VSGRRAAAVGQHKGCVAGWCLAGVWLAAEKLLGAWLLGGVWAAAGAQRGWERGWREAGRLGAWLLGGGERMQQGPAARVAPGGWLQPPGGGQKHNGQGQKV
jgi:hypothetical protein